VRIRGTRIARPPESPVQEVEGLRISGTRYTGEKLSPKCLTWCLTVANSDYRFVRNWMKGLALTILAAMTLTSVAWAGSENASSKESKQTTPQPFCDWYANQEWNAALWGTYAFTGTDWPDDRYLAVDHAWGGGADFKFFFARYFGIGAEGYLLSGRDTIGAGLGTLTLRYPIPCSRFSPYVYAGAGAIFDGSHIETFGEEGDADFFRVIHSENDARAVGQFGGGLEFRLTPHIGLMQDFNWNVVDGSSNNFGMVRAGLTFAF
jgi:hypothetical protein